MMQFCSTLGSLDFVCLFGIFTEESEMENTFFSFLYWSSDRFASFNGET